jgi:hypothetical protein
VSQPPTEQSVLFTRPAPRAEKVTGSHSSQSCYSWAVAAFLRVNTRMECKYPVPRAPSTGLTQTLRVNPVYTNTHAVHGYYHHSDSSSKFFVPRFSSNTRKPGSLSVHIHNTTRVRTVFLASTANHFRKFRERISIIAPSTV